MAQIKFVGICSGTEQKTSQKGMPYSITNFVDLANMKPFSCFGDLGLPKDLTPKEYVLEASVVQLGAVSVVSGGGSAPAAKK